MASTQEPSVKILKKNKVKLVKWLSADFQVILNQVHAEDIIDDRVYQRLRNKSPPEDACVELIDTLMSRGEGPSSGFLQQLKDPEIQIAYNSQLKDWILSLELPGPTEQQRANIGLPVAGPSESQRANGSLSDEGIELFFNDRRGELVSRVKTVGPILDNLQSSGLHGEMAASVHAGITPQASMRKILDNATSKRARNALFNALLKHEAGVMEDLLGYIHLSI